MKLGYFFLLYAQTALTLAAVGLAGGGILAWVRRPHRPWLWLASPLVGLTALGVLLPVLHHGVGMTIPASVVAALGVLSLHTLCWLARSRPEVRWRRWGPGVAVLVAVLAWAVYGCNRPALRHGEPCIYSLEGSDMYGYAPYADWLLSHPGEAPPAYDPEQPHLAYVRYMWEIDTRHGAYTLLAAAAWVRGTSALFSFDWLNGVVLAAGAAAVAGLFAGRRTTLVLLALAAVLSAWFPTSRVGFFGKVCAYPGAVLLAYAVWTCWERFSWRALAAVAVLGAGVSLHLHYGLAQAVCGLVFGGGLLGGLVCRARISGGPVPPGQQRVSTRERVAFLTAAAAAAAALALGLPQPLLTTAAGVALASLVVLVAGWQHRVRPQLPCAGGLTWKCLGVGTAAFLAAVAPVMVWSRWVGEQAAGDCYCPIHPWDWLLPLALDLESAQSRLLPPALVGWLLAVSLALSLLLLLTAYLRRRPEAFSLLLAAWVVPAASAVGPNRLYLFLGLLFPLSACGASLALESMARMAPAWSRRLVLLLAAGLLAVRGPQWRAQWDRYTTLTSGPANYFVRSDIEALAAKIGPRPVDAITNEIYNSFVVMVELPRLGCRLHMREPTWTTMLSWARVMGPEWAAPPSRPWGRFMVRDAGTVSAGLEDRAAFGPFELTEGPTVAVTCIRNPNHLEHDADGPFFWLGREPAQVELYNWLDRPQVVRLVAQGVPGPSVADPSQRRLRCTFNGTDQLLPLGTGNNWALDLALTIPPGKHEVSLVALDPPDRPPLSRDSRDLVLMIRRIRLQLETKGAPPRDGRAEGVALEGRE